MTITRGDGYMLPLTAAQEGIWWGQKMAPHSPVYNTAECIELVGSFAIDDFLGAVAQAVVEVEGLHMRFVEGDDGLWQVHVDPGELTPPVLEVGDQPDAWTAVRAFIDDDLSRPVDLGRGPLYRQVVFRAGPDRHIWYLRVHHIALDGYGYSLLSARVAQLYSARQEGRAAPASRHGSLRSLIDAERSYASSSDFEDDRRFWTRYLRDRSTAPILCDSPAIATRSPRRHRTDLAAELMGRVASKAESVGASWPALVMAAVAHHVHRSTGCAEVTLGVPMMGRMGSVAARVPGMVMNIVPVRVPCPGRVTTLELTRRVARAMGEIRAHARYRHEALKREHRALGEGRRLFGPVVNIMPFVTELRLPGLETIIHRISAGPVEDLSFGVRARPSGADAEFEVEGNPDSYDHADITVHGDEVLELLERAASNESPRDPHSGQEPTVQPLTGDALVEPARDVIELVFERARDCAERVAVEHGDRQLTYRELAAAVRVQATRLRQHGVGDGDLVVIALQRSVATITSILATMAVGAAYVPLDPDGPADRTGCILDDARPRLLITDRAHAHLATRTDGEVLLVDADDPFDAAVAAVPSDRDPVASAAADTTGYVIYTSGSTGRPNGVLIGRAALAHFVASATAAYGWRIDDRVLQFAALQFDASVEEIFLTLCRGATLVLRTDDMLDSLTALVDGCQARGITILDLPTALWHELVDRVAAGSFTLPTCLRQVIIGGEEAAAERVAAWRRTIGTHPVLLNTYGPTEATVVAAFADLSRSSENQQSVPIGRPLPGTHAVVLDERLGPVPAGETGELYLIGPNLAQGYLNRPRLNAERFVSVRTVAGQPRAYRTGDRVRADESGALVFAGRVDQEVKISGQRVDPSEVEATLRAHPSIREAAVTVIRGTGQVPLLTAHYVANAPYPSVAELRQHAGERLLAAAVPRRFVHLDRLPTNASGKVDRAGLRTLSAHDQDRPLASVPEGEIARVAHGIWSDVLGIAGCDPDENFFDLGGQSLQALQVSSRLSAGLERDVPVSLIFAHPTLRGLCRALEVPQLATVDTTAITREMDRDAELPSDIGGLPKPSSRPLSGQAGNLLLTGATGFVGVYLLHAFLCSSTRRVVCLVRADSEAAGLARVRSSLDTHGMLTPAVERALAERVQVQPGDIGKPRFGLTTRRYQFLADTCDTVIHSAATVSLVRSYASMRASNVLGALEVLRLASRGMEKTVHHVSTLAVASGHEQSPAEVPEAFVPRHDGLRDGYSRSKWVAERLMEQASGRGIPLAVYRLGRVVGPTRSGFVNHSDILWRIVRSGVPVGILPQLDVREPWTPVDYVASVIVQLVQNSTANGRVVHVSTTREVRWLELFKWIGDYGYRVHTTSVSDWCRRLESDPRAETRATLSFFEMRRSEAPSQATLGLGRIRTDNLESGLADSGLRCDPIDRTAVHRYLDYCVAQGLLPPTECRAPQTPSTHP
ncbi:MAG: amino acid adenylation domain-containing protein [Proteobacteria bacterium]|nr:amino acid adenylation domain-containing protein [Pseudomonadota bacterium]